mmetsp:Transcript_11572/g.12759  ORF Transcript_11572/g.12759 Transcript_11572/m.12759 type:complete len:120 (+) Transcript_11572:93-452(+)
MADCDAAPLYQDKFVEISADHLRIKCYYFPFGQDKVITISDGVSFATDQELSFGNMDRKAWGMALNNVWWAQDMRRRCWSVAHSNESTGSPQTRNCTKHKLFVRAILVTGHCTKKGLVH